MIEKECTSCKETKSVEDYHKAASRKDGRTSFCKECNNQRNKEWREKNKDKRRITQRNYQLKMLYDIDLEDYQNILDRQENLCACCGTKGKLVVDHCHRTGKVRGLLCWTCNTGLGKLGDTEEGLERALRYLRSHKVVDTD